MIIMIILIIKVIGSNNNNNSNNGTIVIFIPANLKISRQFSSAISPVRNTKSSHKLV